MEIKINLDIENIIAEAVTKERLQPIIDKAVSEAIADSIRNATGYNSTFRKVIQEQLGETLPHGLNIDQCAKFQHVLNTTVNDAVCGANADAIKTAISNSIASIMPDVPPVVKLSEIMKQARGALFVEDHEEIFAKLELSEYGGGHLAIDSDPRLTSQYRARFRLSFSKDGRVYSLVMDTREITPATLPDAVGAFDGILLAMYTGRTTIDIDMDEDDVTEVAGERID